MSIFDPYMPKSIHNVTFSSLALEKVIKKIVAGIQQEHLLLHGASGAGKSKIAELLIAEMYPATAKTASYIFDGVDWTAGHTKRVEGTMNAWMMTGLLGHFTVINEVDWLAPEKIAGVRRFMDKHANHKFIMTTNHAGKLPGNFLNRCSVHQVHMEPAASVASKVVQVFADHQQPISPAHALQLVAASNGSWRTLEQLIHAQLP